MATIEYKNEKYIFSDKKLTTEEWMQIPPEASGRAFQAEVVALLSIEPKLTMDVIKTKGFDFIPTILNQLNCLGE